MKKSFDEQLSTLQVPLRVGNRILYPEMFQHLRVTSTKQETYLKKLFKSQEQAKPSLFPFSFVEKWDQDPDKLAHVMRLVKKLQGLGKDTPHQFNLSEKVVVEINMAKADIGVLTLLSINNKQSEDFVLTFRATKVRLKNTEYFVNIENFYVPFPAALDVDIDVDLDLVSRLIRRELSNSLVRTQLLSALLSSEHVSLAFTDPISGSVESLKTRVEVCQHLEEEHVQKYMLESFAEALKSYSPGSILPFNVTETLSSVAKIFPLFESHIFGKIKGLVLRYVPTNRDYYVSKYIYLERRNNVLIRCTSSARWVRDYKENN